MDSTTFSPVHMLNKVLTHLARGMVPEQLDLDEITKLKLFGWLLIHKRDETCFSLSLLPSLPSSFPLSL